MAWWIELHCDICKPQPGKMCHTEMQFAVIAGMSRSNYHAVQLQMKALNKQAMDRGWRRVQNTLWACPGCQKG